MILRQMETLKLYNTGDTNTSYCDIAILKMIGLRKVKKGDIYAAGIR